MPGLIFDNTPLCLDDVAIVNYLDDATLTLPIPKCGSKRRREIKHVVLHTTGGYADQCVLNEPAPDSACHARAVVNYWRNDDRIGGAHILVDADGTCYCLADLVAVAAYHCVGFNQVSVGIEVVQQRNGSLYAAQLRSVAAVVNAIATKLSLPRSVAVAYDRKPRSSVDGIGVVGHRDLSANRGAGDPGDFILQAVADVGGWTAV